MTVVNAVSSFPTGTVTCVSKAAPAPTANFATGARSDMIYVRACLAVDPMLPLVGDGLGLPRNPSGGFNVVSTSGFMNEP
jgi:hypothetical protein